MKCASIGATIGMAVLTNLWPVPAQDARKTDSGSIAEEIAAFVRNPTEGIEFNEGPWVSFEVAAKREGLLKRIGPSAQPAVPTLIAALKELGNTEIPCFACKALGRIGPGAADAIPHLIKAVRGNSGLYFRVDEVRSGVGVHGFQAEIDPANDIGGLYETDGRAWVVQPTPEQVKTYFKPGQWNEMSVTAEGRRVVVHVNGRKTAELKEDPGRLEGHLALQLHGGQDMHVEFKDVEIRVKD